MYTVSHVHRCAQVPNGYDERWPRVNQGSAAFTDAATGTLLPELYGWFNRGGAPAPTLLDFSPNWYGGTYTSSDQAAWNVTGTEEYVLFGGEFIGLNGKLQQGLTRMAIPKIAPNLVGPVTTAEMTPTVVSYKAGEAAVGFKATYDADNTRLTYKVYRNYVSQSDTPVFMTTSDSTWHDRGGMSFIDKGLTPGSTVDYLVTASDPFGNRRASGRTSVTIATGSTTSQPYGQTVLQDGPEHYFRFTGSPATTLQDLGTNEDATTLGTVTSNASTPLKDSGDTSATFSGVSSTYSANRIQGQAPNTMSVEAWVKTSDSTGGRIAGFSTAYSNNSQWNDRLLYVDDTGRIRFGVIKNNATKVTVSSGTGFANDAWHHVVGTLSGDGMNLYVDGKWVDGDASVTAGQRMAGSWRIGQDTLSGWESVGTDGRLAGQIDEVATYSKALTLGQVQSHYNAAGNGVVGPPANQSPTAVISTSQVGQKVSFNGTGSTDPDGSIASYAWEFGDGTTGTGGTVDHTYNNGNYTAKLTVTDNQGAKNTASTSVVVGAAAPLGSDSFERSVALGSWGTADVGGSWAACSRCQVASGAGQMNLRAGDSPRTLLSGISSTATDVSSEVSIDKAPSTGGTFLAVVARGSGADGYRARVTLPETGSASVTLQKVVGGASTSLKLQNGSAATVSLPALVFTPGTKIAIRVQAVGTSPTELKVKVWNASQAEPSSWTLSTTDNDTNWQKAGSPGTWAYAPSTIANAPVIVSWDNIRVAQDGVVGVPANQSPTAVISKSQVGQTVSFNGTGSTDPDGSIASYAWEFGDGTTGTGGTVDHTYSNGNYTAKLTVTDNQGAKNTATTSVVVGSATLLGSDSFERSVALGSWGTADVGGSWAACSRCQVTSGAGAGQMNLRAGDSPRTLLSGISSTATDVSAEVSIDKAPSTGGTFLGVIARGSGADGYRARVTLPETGSASVTLQKVVGGASTSLKLPNGSAATVSLPTLVFTPGTKIAIRVQAVGTSPTELKVKVWNASQAEPSSWTLSTTDNDTNWQKAGSPGTWAYAPSTIANAPVIVSWDNIRVASVN